MAKVVSNGLGIALHGKAGNAVFATTRYGVVLRPRTRPANPRTPNQIAARARLSQAAAQWKTLTTTQRAAWQKYAQSLALTNSAAGTSAAPAPHLVYIALGSKYLQVHPTGTLPVNPPAAPFFGDGITVAAQGGAGRIVFVASGPNSANIVTELLLQPVVHGGRAPKANLYRPQAFVGFTAGSLSAAVTLPKGWVAPAYRFVHSLTGQEVAIVRLANVQIA